MTNPPPPPFPPGGLPPSPDRIDGKKVWVSIGIVLLVQLFAVGIPIGVAVWMSSSDGITVGGWLLALGQLLVFVGCMGFGIYEIQRGRRSYGLGWIIGWAVVTLALPVVGAGVCTAILATSSAG